MKKRIKVLVLTIMLAMSSMSMSAYAAETNNFQLSQVSQENANMETLSNLQYGLNNFSGNPYARTDTIHTAELSIGIVPDGIYVVVDTATNVIASEIGIENLIIEEKTLLGWKEVASCTAYVKNSDTYLADATYYGAKVGKEYRLRGTHYAIMNGVKHTVENETSPILF